MTETAGPARLLLVRHGQIEANVTRVWHGSTDSPLTPRGEDQARRVAGFLAKTRTEVAALYTSPLRRTRDTAEHIGAALGLEPQPLPGLVEYGIGELEGVSYRALFEEHRFFHRIFRDRDFAPPGGESLREVVERATASLFEIASAHPGAEVIAVGHGAAMGLALAHLLEDDPIAWQKYQAGNCSVSELVLEPEPRLLHFDETDHLDDG